MGCMILSIGTIRGPREQCPTKQDRSKAPTPGQQVVWATQVVPEDPETVVLKELLRTAPNKTAQLTLDTSRYATTCC